MKLSFRVFCLFIFFFLTFIMFNYAFGLVKYSSRGILFSRPTWGFHMIVAQCDIDGFSPFLYAKHNARRHKWRRHSSCPHGKTWWFVAEPTNMMHYSLFSHYSPFHVKERFLINWKGCFVCPFPLKMILRPNFKWALLKKGLSRKFF